jgi:hypothetical protein
VKISRKELAPTVINAILHMEKMSSEVPRISSRHRFVYLSNKPEIAKKVQNVDMLMAIKSLDPPPD